jgi:hypothetical protein
VPLVGYEGDPDMLTTPLEEAARAGNVDILKRLKPQDHPEMLGKLIEAIWLKT